MSPMTLVARHAPDHAILTNISRDNDFVLAHRADLAWEEPGQPPPCAIRAMHPRGQPLAYAVVYLAAAL